LIGIIERFKNRPRLLFFFGDYYMKRTGNQNQAKVGVLCGNFNNRAIDILCASSKGQSISYDVIEFKTPDPDSLKSSLSKVKKGKSGIDVLVLNEDIIFNGGNHGNGYKAAAAFGFGEQGMVPVVLLSSNHLQSVPLRTWYKRELTCNPDSYKGRFRTPAKYSENTIFGYVFDMEQVGPMLKHMDAVVRPSGNTRGDIYEIVRRAITQEFMGDGLFTDPEIQPSRTPHKINELTRSGYWHQIKEDLIRHLAKQKKMHYTGRLARYSERMHSYLS
jgi:hypothetical protein